MSNSYQDRSFNRYDYPKSKRDDYEYSKKKSGRDFAGTSVELVENPSYQAWRMRSEECIDRLIGEIGIIKSELNTIYDRYQEERVLWRRGRRELEDRVEALTLSIEAEEQALVEASRQYRTRFAELTLENKSLRTELGGGARRDNVIAPPPPPAVTVKVPSRVPSKVEPPVAKNVEEEEGSSIFGNAFKSLKTKLIPGEEKPPDSEPVKKGSEDNTEIVNLKKKLAETETKLKEKTSELQTTSEKLKQSTKESDTAKTSGDADKKDRDTLKEQLAKEQEASKKMKAELDLLQREGKRSTVDSEKLKTESAKKNEECEKMTAEIARLKEEMKVAKEESDRVLSEKTEAYETSAKEMTTELDRHRMRHKSIEKKLRTMKEVIEKKKHTDESLIKDMDELIAIQESVPTVSFFTKMFN